MPVSATQLAIVVPCYNEHEVLPASCDRLVRLLTRLEAAGKISAASHIVFVDDGSTDATWSIIADFVQRGLPVTGIKLSRNEGHQNALLAGLLSASGDAIASLDADLQDDPDAIELMLDQFHVGADVVFGVPKRPDDESTIKRVAALVFYRVMRAITSHTVDDHADCRLLSRRAVDSLARYREVNLFLRGVVTQLGYRSAVVTYQRGNREGGRSKYPFGKQLGLALTGITSSSVVPLRSIAVVGAVITLGTVIVSAWTIGAVALAGRDAPAWAPVVLPLYFLGGVQLLALGVVGEYLGKAYAEVRARPRFIIETLLSRAQAEVVVPPP